MRRNVNYHIKENFVATFYGSVYEMQSSFHKIVGGNRGFSPKDRTKSTAIIPVVDCNCKRSIESHASSFSFTGVKDEVDLIILSRAFLFTNPRNIDTLNRYICPSHRESLGLSWKRSSTKCCIPISLGGDRNLYSGGRR